MAAVQPLKLAILAMGGEGGGVLADWVVDLGESNGWLAQTTSVPGVAQRTGATVYYVELYPQAEAERDGAAPVFALMPLPGDVDIVVASELMECGRAVQRGLVTPDRTTLVASTHRVYSIAEKVALGDGRVDSDALLAHAEAAAKRFVRFDMAAAAERSGSVIGAVMFGALAGTGVMPFSRAQFEATIERGGIGVASSLRAFAEAYAHAARGDAAPETGAAVAPPRAGGALAAPASAALDGTTDAPAAGAPDTAPADVSGQSPRDPRVRALLGRVSSAFPASAHAMLKEGVRRLIDYQDTAYASLYLDRLEPLVGATRGLGGGTHGDAARELLDESARHLALWMAYEDTVRVAALKIRGERFERVRNEVHAGADQVLAIDEYLHPRVQEIAETLPAAIGRHLERPGWLRRIVERATARGRVVTTSSLTGFLMLRTVAGMKRWRRSTTRHAVENAAIEAWLARIVATAAADPALAVEIARCQGLVKGYSDTHERGVRNFDALMTVFDRARMRLAPATLRELREAALADENGEALQAMLARHALA